MRKISFMTLGCPKWNMDTICARAKEYGFDGIDFRGYLGKIDLSGLPEFTTGASETIQKIKDAGLEVSGISTNIRVCVKEEVEKNLEEARFSIGLARAFETVNLRIFGGGDLENFSRAELAKIGCDCISQILALDGARDLKWLFETHDNWVQAEDCRLLLNSIQDPAFGALWDMGHTWRIGREKPNKTWESIGSRVGYTHIKDAVYEPDSPLAMKDGWHYVEPGDGDLPLEESLALIAAAGYEGWLTFEHEKHWHPKLPEPEEILPKFVAWIRGLYPV